MASLPPCPNNAKKMGCPRSDPELIGDATKDGTSWGFRCRTCRTCYVITKPVGVAAARYRNEVTRLQKQQEAIRRREQARRYFT